MHLQTGRDPAPLSCGQAWAVLAAAGRELTWGLRHTAHELRRWRAIAQAIPDATLRADALHALDHKRGYADGAALFTILPRRRNASLLRTLVAYETIVDYLDNVSERHPTHDNGQQLHRALTDALDPDRPLTDYYLHHIERDDGGYLLALVTTCRRGCRSLPSYEHVRTRLARETHRSRVLGLNHEPDPIARDAGLRAWAAEEYPHERELTWWELSGAASATLLTHALLALAAVPDLEQHEIDAVTAAHWPWIALATTNLDSYVDWIADHDAGAHSYLDHYPDHDTALSRTRESITIAIRRGLQAPRGHRHAVIVACMVALYLSAPAASAPQLRASTTSFTTAGGQLVRMLVPILRTWRAINRQRE